MNTDIAFQRRNRLKNHFVNTSNVLLWCYRSLSDAARRLFQVLDSFDYLDAELGTSKGFVYPSVETLAAIMDCQERSIHRYLKELIVAKLITRQRRRNRSSLFIIEDISQEQIDLYIKLRKQVFSRGGNSGGGGNTKSPQVPNPVQKSRTDRFVGSREAPETTDLSIAYKEEEKEKKKKNVNVVENESVGEKPHSESHQPPANSKPLGGMTSMAELMGKYQPTSKIEHLARSEDEQILRREAVANDLAQSLGDEQSLGCYRVIAEKIPQQIVFETLAQVKELESEGKINTTPGAMFVYKIKQYAQRKGTDLKFTPT